ncbi:MAG TPA: PepSY domain-containing protein [Allosphingosinicella sp.]|nr:PepSY domain-containing protein [Allosphingosinicella sp.]
MKPLFFRRIHKWVGLILGIQFLIWTISGTAMALIDHEQVSGGHAAPAPEVQPLPNSGSGWAKALHSIGGAQITAAALRPLLDRNVFEVATPGGVRLFDAASGDPIVIDGNLVRRIAEAAYDGQPKVVRVVPLAELTLAVRTHQLPIWRVDFADERNSSFYVSGSTGKLLERRNDSWRAWDFFWMLHNMDYANRTSFNHPLIVTIAFGTIWLALTGFYLLFKASWRREARWLRDGQQGRRP